MAVETHSVAGIVAGRNPLEYSTSSPYTLFLFQATFIILLCQILHFPLKRLQQPRVIAEVITGILLGPSVMGHIPQFTTSCFPKESIPGLTLIANVGIILFLFVIGLEVDVEFIKKNMKVALSVGLINMAVPFALGCGIAKGLYKEYSGELTGEISFTTFMVFIAVAMCITAFPVLVRILTELNLIVDRVGTIVLAAGITNDLTGWILLALAVTLANSSKGINTLYILLLTAAWFLFLIYPVRMCMRLLLKKFTNDLISGEPLQILMMLILICVFISSFYTDAIGVHPIFGAFMVGVIVPRDNGYVIRITEKLEDLIHIVLIPIYFALAGLNVNLGLLNRGIDWAYTIGIILLAMFGKIMGGFVAARFNKLLFRESLAVGVLMSCKGIVEIVVLSLGLNAGIISQRVYSMFVVMALITTFLTTPLTLWVYPISYREKVEKFMKGEINWDGSPIHAEVDTSNSDPSEDCDGSNTDESCAIKDLHKLRITKLVLLLKRIDTISNIMTVVHDIALNDGNSSSNYDLDVKALHLREFTSRTSDLLEASSQHNDNDSLINQNNENDINESSSILAIMKIFTQFLGIHYTSKSLLSTQKNHIFTINEQILERSDLLISSIDTRILVQFPLVGSYYNNEHVDSSEYSLYKELFKSCKSNFGLLLINNTKAKHAMSPINENEPSNVKASNYLEQSKSLFGLKSVNLVLSHDNLISSSDLLALNIIYKLSFNISHINIFIKASSSKSVSNTSTMSSFEKEIESLLLTRNPTINLSIFKIKESVNFVDELIRISPNLLGETFVMANNLPQNSNLMFDSEVSELIATGITEGFNILAVKTASSN